MVLFLYASISLLMCKVMLCFIKKEVISDAKMLSKLFDMEVALKKSNLLVQEMDIGVRARNCILSLEVKLVS